MQSHEDVEKMGVANYNAECRKIVMRYSSEWETIVTRMGRWIDFKNDYKTLYPWFMESIWCVCVCVYNMHICIYVREREVFCIASMKFYTLFSFIYIHTKGECSSKTRVQNNCQTHAPSMAYT